MKMHKVAVVILNWNGKKYLEKFLPTLIKYTKDDAELIVADNDSSDDSVSYLEENFPNIRIIKNSENGGFSKGYNDALRHVDAKYYVLLNSDIEVTENWVLPVIELMDNDSSIAACQPKLLAYDDPNRFEYSGAAGGFIDKFGYPFCRGRLFETLEEDKGQYDNTCEIFWASGACMFVRADLYHKLGGLDEDFFAHMEEIDFCWRLKNEGYKIMFCPHSKVYHIGGGTLPKNNARKTYYNFRNNFALLYKNLPKKRIKRVFATRFLLDIIAAFKFLVEGGFKNFFAVTRAHIAFYKRLSKFRKKRGQQSHNFVSLVYTKSIVWNYYVGGKKTFNKLKQKSFTTSSKG